MVWVTFELRGLRENPLEMMGARGTNQNIHHAQRIYTSMSSCATGQCPLLSTAKQYTEPG